MDTIKTAKIELTLKNGQKIKLEKFGKDLIMTDVPYGFSKEDEEYISLKKSLFSILFGRG